MTRFFGELGTLLRLKLSSFAVAGQLLLRMDRRVSPKEAQLSGASGKRMK